MRRSPVRIRPGAYKKTGIMSRSFCSEGRRHEVVDSLPALEGRAYTKQKQELRSNESREAAVSVSKDIYFFARFVRLPRTNVYIAEKILFF